MYSKSLRRLLVCTVTIALALVFGVTGITGTAHAAVSPAPSATPSASHIIVKKFPLSSDLTPDISPAKCGSAPGGWLVVYGGGFMWCFGGGGSMNVSIACVSEIDTNNNWGHFQMSGYQRQLFSYSQTWSFNCTTLATLWLYE